MFECIKENRKCNERTVKSIALFLVLSSYFITAIDGSIVITGLKRIAEDLQLSSVSLSWVQNAYVLVFGGFMLLGGRLGDTLGRKRMFNLSLMLFGFGSLGAGVAPSAGIMIAARFVQGVGAAVMAPAALALIMDYFEGEKRTKAVAWYGSISGIGLCFGLIIGGAVTTYLTWRDGFLINVPIVGVMLFLSVKYLLNADLTKHRFDIIGTLLSVAGVFCVIYAIDGASAVALWLVSGIVLLTLLVHAEQKAPMPIMPLSLFHSRTRRNAYVARALLIAALMGYNFFISEFMQDAFHFTPLLTGLAFLPMTITTFLGAVEVPKLVHKYGNKKILYVGLSLVLLGFFLLLSLTVGKSYLYVIAFSILFIGMGQGLAMSPLTNLGIEDVDKRDSGAASGLVNASHQIGGALGLSLMTAASNGVVDAGMRCHIGMAVALVCIILALGISAFPSMRYLYTLKAGGSKHR